MKAFDRLSDKRNFPHPASVFQPINPDFSPGSRYLSLLKIARSVHQESFSKIDAFLIFLWIFLPE